MNPNQRIYVAGHAGLVGSALLRRLQRAGHSDILVRERAELDLRDAEAVDRFFRTERPDIVFLAAAKVGGILANSTNPVLFLQDNLQIQLSVIAAAHRYGVAKLLFLGSSCIYPKHAPQPMKEEHLLAGPLEPTNEWYAIAKIAGLKLCQAYCQEHGARFISVMPTNLYGPNDNFDLESSHVVPALIRKFHRAAESGADRVVVWGTGTPRREFLHVDDLADACLFIMDRYEEAEPINVGVGNDISIGELAGLIANVVGYRGMIEYDRTKPDGTPRKLLDVTRLTDLGWSPRIPLREGIGATYDWYLAQRAPVLDTAQA